MTTTHVDDGDLIRWLDGEVAAEEGRAVRAHLADCAACAARLGGLRTRARAVSRVLAAADPPVVGRRRIGWGMRAAAAGLVLLGVGLVVEPVRAWILERAEGAWSLVAARETPAPASAPDEPQGARPDPVAGTVSFIPAGDVFRLEVAARQAGGELVIEMVEADAASATVEADGADEQFVVLPSGLRIVNAAGSGARYVVRLPARLQSVVLVIGDEPGRRYAPAEAGERWTVPLGDRTGSR